MARSANCSAQGTDRLRHQVLEGAAGYRDDGTFRRTGGGRDGDVSNDETGDGAHAERRAKAPGHAARVDYDGRRGEVEGRSRTTELIGNAEVSRRTGRHDCAKDGKEGRQRDGKPRHSL